MTARVPDTVKRLRGSYTNHRARAEPELHHGMPTVPGSLNSQAKLIWMKAAQLLDEMGCLTLADTFALEAFAKVAEQKAQVEERIRREGVFITQTDRHGKEVLVAHPAMKLDSDLDHRYLAYLAKLGLTPADRTKLVANPVSKEDNQFEGF